MVPKLADDLAKAKVCGRDGILYAAGSADGYAYFGTRDEGEHWVPM
jgi:hypothetical protein